MIRLSNCTSQLMRLYGTTLAARRSPSPFKFSRFGKMANKGMMMKSRGADGNPTSSRNISTSEVDFPPLSAALNSKPQKGRKPRIDLGGGTPPSRMKSKEARCNDIMQVEECDKNSATTSMTNQDTGNLSGRSLNLSPSTAPESREPNDGLKQVQEEQKESSACVAGNQVYDIDLPDNFVKKQTPYYTLKPPGEASHELRGQLKISNKFSSNETVDEPTDKIEKSNSWQVLRLEEQQESSARVTRNQSNDDTGLPDSFGKKPTHFKPQKPIWEASNERRGWPKRSTEFSPTETVDEHFNICFPDRIRKSKRGQVLRPGMVLFKNYIPISQQVDIVSKCYELGEGSGGFYRPGYKDGAKLRLHMMCLGLDWDPQTRKYGKTRKHDNAAPPDIPSEFATLVGNVLKDSHALIEAEMKVANVEDVLPKMSPDLCIVNFYNTTGRLGLHQDRDESWESLDKGLPVVSISIGDSAEFLYGDKRYIDEAESVVLESGDVLVFGGESRLVFHGVSKVYPRTAPPGLLREAGIRPGRLNLTFRKY